MEKNNMQSQKYRDGEEGKIIKEFRQTGGDADKD